MKTTSTPIMFLEDKRALLKQRRGDVLNKLKMWTERLKENPESTEAKRKVDIYTELANRIKFELKYSTLSKKRGAQKKEGRKWSLVLPGSFESGKRR